MDREISSWADLWKHKSAILHCSWCPFVSNESCFSTKFYFSMYVLPLYSRVLTLLKLNYLYLLRCPDNCLRGKLPPRQFPPEWLLPSKQLPPRIIACKENEPPDNCPGQFSPRIIAQLPPRKIAPRIIVPQTIVPWMNAPGILSPGQLPRGKFFPG